MSSRLDQLMVRVRKRLLACRDHTPDEADALARACRPWLQLETIRPGLYRSREVPGLVISHWRNPFGGPSAWVISHRSWPTPVEAGLTMKEALAHLAVALDIDIGSDAEPSRRR